MSDWLVSSHPSTGPGQGQYAKTQVAFAEKGRSLHVCRPVRRLKRDWLPQCRDLAAAGLVLLFEPAPALAWWSTDLPKTVAKVVGRRIDDAAMIDDGGVVLVLALGVLLVVGLGGASLAFWWLIRTQRQQLESQISALQVRLQRLESQSAPAATGGTAPEVTPRAELTALQSDMHSLREEIDYLKNKVSTLLTAPETPPHPLPALSGGMVSTPTHKAVDTLPVSTPPSRPFENQRVSDIIARYRERLRSGHVDALTRHFSINPSGLFLELEDQGERFIFPAQEVVYADDFQQNYSFVYDCDHPGSGYVVVVTPARLDARGQVIARGRLRVE